MVKKLVWNIRIKAFFRYTNVLKFLLHRTRYELRLILAKVFPLPWIFAVPNREALGVYTKNTCTFSISIIHISLTFLFEEYNIKVIVNILAYNPLNFAPPLFLAISLGLPLPFSSNSLCIISFIKLIVCPSVLLKKLSWTKTLGSSSIHIET